MMGLWMATMGVWLGMLGGPDSPVRESAIDSLVISGQVDAVTQVLYEQNWRTREGLIAVLERLGAVDALARIATQHSKTDAQRLAIRSMGKIGQADAQMPLRNLLTSEHRDLAVEALGRVGDQTDIVRVRYLLQDARADVRRRAALALVQLAGNQAIDDLVFLLGDPHHSVRFAVFTSLLGFGLPSADAILPVYDGLPVVGKQLALRLFGQLRYSLAQAIFEDVLGKETFWPLQVAGIRALAEGKDAKWIPILKKAQKEVSSPIVKMAIQDAIEQLQ
jgi:hypothetical protein